MASIGGMFIPKQKLFYNLFEEVSQNIVTMAVSFQKALKEKDYERRITMLKDLESLEHKNDDLTHTLFIELGRNFITPFDREDIHALASALDDVADYIWSSGKRIINYQMHEMDEAVHQMAALIYDATTTLQIAVNGLRNMKDMQAITEACLRINVLENDADDLLDLHTTKLFESEKNAVELIKRKDLYEELEIVTDKCEDAANVVESIVIKYS